MPDQKSSRRSFLSRLGFGTAAVAATAVVPNVGAPTTPEPIQPSLRPKCPNCGTLMLVREDAKCPNTECFYYWKSVGITLIGPQADRELQLAQKRIEELRAKYRKELEANVWELGKAKSSGNENIKKD